MSLLAIHDQMVKEAEEAEEGKTAEEATEQEVEVLAKYATVADEMLTKDHGEDYTEDDVAELAGYLIDHDMEVQAQQEKVAEYIEAGQIMARSFSTEMAKLAAEADQE